MSGTTGGGFSLTSLAMRKVKVKAVRNEFKQPRQAGKGKRRPQK